MNRMVKSVTGMLLLACVASCASWPVDRAKTQNTDPPPRPLPRSVAIAVKLYGKSLYGTREEWDADMRRVLEALDACAWVVPASKAVTADLAVTIVLSRTAALDESDIKPTGALLGFLAWSTIPLLPLWVYDVEVTPKLHVRVDRSLRSRQGEPQLPPSDFDVASVSTSYLDRRPFFSWPTLGAIFVPPFVFSGTEQAHVEAEVGSWVREATAVKVAEIVRASRPEGGELLEGVSVRAGGTHGAVLDLTPGDGLLHVVARVKGKDVGSKDFGIRGSEAGSKRPERIDLDLDAADGTPSHVNVIAVGDDPGWILSYTVRVPPEAGTTSAPASGSP